MKECIMYIQQSCSILSIYHVQQGEQFWVKRGNDAVSNALQTESVFVDMQDIPDAAFIRTFRGQKRMVFFSGELGEFIEPGGEFPEHGRGNSLAWACLGGGGGLSRSSPIARLLFMLTCLLQLVYLIPIMSNILYTSLPQRFII